VPSARCLEDSYLLGVSDYKGEHVSEHSIDQGRERFLEAWLTNDPDALMRELDDDVVFMPPGHEPARGKAAVRAWFEAAIAESTTVSL
jgi:ketosteroid isomerase-like protein